MQNNTIPKTDLRVSPICMGTMTFGTPVGEADAIKIVHWGIDNGVNFIDTANMYEGYTRYVGSPGGVGEEFLGEALKGRRGHAVVATKVGMKVGSAPEDEGTSPKAIHTQLDRSLHRLQTDYVDIYYLHRPDPEVPLADIVGTMADVTKQGKIRYYGISNYSADQTADILKAADDAGVARPVIHQPPYSLLERDVEKDLFPLCDREKIAVAPYRVLQGGLLTGKYKRGKPAPQGSRKQEKEAWIGEITDDVFDRIEAIEADAEKKASTLMEYALKETLAFPAVVAVITGVKRIDQLESLIAAVS